MEKCTKKYFDSHHKAQLRCIVINGENKRNKDTTKLRPYKCESCDGFHLTSMSGGLFHKVRNGIEQRRRQKQYDRVKIETDYWENRLNLD